MRESYPRYALFPDVASLEHAKCALLLPDGLRVLMITNTTARYYNARTYNAKYYNAERAAGGARFQQKLRFGHEILLPVLTEWRAKTAATFLFAVTSPAVRLAPGWVQSASFGRAPVIRRTLTGVQRPGMLRLHCWTGKGLNHIAAFEPSTLALCSRLN